MSNSDAERPRLAEEEDEAPSKGPNLVLIYSLLGLALIIATVVAAFIVFPFYQRR